MLGADGAVFTKIGGGAPHVDMAQAAAQLRGPRREDGAIVEDMSTDGSQEGMLLFDFQGLDALVNVGGGQETLQVPAMERVVGAEGRRRRPRRAAGELRRPLRLIEQIGATRVQALIRRLGDLVWRGAAEGEPSEHGNAVETTADRSRAVVKEPTP